MANQKEHDVGGEKIGYNEETVVIRRPELKESGRLLDSFKQNWQALSDTVAKKGDEIKGWLSGFRKAEKLAPHTARSIHEETTRILQPTADAVRARKVVKFASPEETKSLQDMERKQQAMRDIGDAASMIELQESNGVSIEAFTDSAGYRFNETPEQRENQDYVLTADYGSVVADGMGGGALGKEAAEIVAKSFMEGLKAVKTGDEKKFINAMQVSGKQAKARLEGLAGKEMTGGAVVATKVLETLPDGSKKVGVAWSGDVWSGVITSDGKVDNHRQTIDHSAVNDLFEIRDEKDPNKQAVLLDKFAETMANNDATPNASFEQKKQTSAKLIKNWASMSDDMIQKLAPKLRMMMTHSINNQEKNLKIDSKVWILEPGESQITLTDGYTDVLKVPEDIERAVKIARQSDRPVMQVLTQLYLEALGKGGTKKDNIGGTFMTVEVNEWDEKTNPDFRIPSEDDFYDEKTQPWVNQ